MFMILNLRNHYQLSIVLEFLFEILFSYNKVIVIVQYFTFSDLEKICY